MSIVTVDPGPIRSAYLVYDADASARCLAKGIDSNEALRDFLLRDIDTHVRKAGLLVIEQMEHYGSGMPAGKSVFDTCIWIGRFLQAWNGPYILMPRSEVKIHLCQSVRATDANIRQAILDLFPAGAVGVKHAPGPLYGVHHDLWSALAIAITATDHGVITDGVPCKRCGHRKTLAEP